MEYIELENLEQNELLPGFKVRFVHTPNMTFAHWNIDAGSALPEHSHHHEQVVNMLEGCLELTVEGKKHELKPGSVVVIPPNVMHSGAAKTDCRVLDVFHPMREDYKG